MVIEQIEVLEYHSHMLSDPVNIYLFIGNELSVKPDLTACRCFKKVQAAEKGALTGTGGSYDNNLFSLVDMIAHPF